MVLASWLPLSSGINHWGTNALFETNVIKGFKCCTEGPYLVVSKSSTLFFTCHSPAQNSAGYNTHEPYGDLENK